MVNWEEAEWTLHSKARVIKANVEGEGPCRKESQVQVFLANFHYHKDCMQHCEKISGGRSPSVTTREEWEYFTREVDVLIPPHHRVWLPDLWLSATEGDENRMLARLDHWNDTELVNNETLKLEAVETIWRDFYTGQRLGEGTKPLIYDTRYGDTYNCMMVYTDKPWEYSWYEWECITSEASCPCSYPTQPLLKLRGVCSSSSIDNLFLLKQLPTNTNFMIILGQTTTRIDYNNTISRWILTDAVHGVTGSSRATKRSYLLGKHEWTISNDDYECGKGRQYTNMLKLTGCAEDEFTCDDGQCIKMERRCDQVTGKEPHCRD